MAKETRKKSALRENVESFLWAIALALLIRTFIIAPYKIPSGSMLETLQIGDRLMVNKYTYRFNDPAPGDIVVFKYPLDKKRPFIKRLIASGGDEVEIRGGHLYVNGERLVEPEFFEHNTYTNQGAYGQRGQVVKVPEGSYYFLGDNSMASQDSRSWGFVSEDLIIGKAVCIFWPPSRIRKLN